MSHAGAREAWLSEGRQRRGRCVVRVRVRVCTCVMRARVCVGGSLRTPSPDRSPFLRDGQGLLRRA